MNKYIISNAILVLMVAAISGCGSDEQKQGTPVNEVSVNTPEVISVSPSIPTNNNSPIVSGTAQGLLLIKFYSDSTCTTQIGIGNTISDGSFAIAVDVPDNSTTTIYANAFNGSYSSACSSTFVTYVEDSGTPSVITFTSTNPISPSESTTAVISGTAEMNSTVKLYTNATCVGAPAYTVTTSGAGIFSANITVALNSTTVFRGTSTDGAGNTSACSSTSITYVSADMTAPLRPVITSITPIGPANNNAPVIAGTAEANSTVRFFSNATCTSAVVGTGTANASGNFSFAGTAVNNTTRTFYANARDANNNVSPCSTTFVTYIEDSAAPAVLVFTGTNPASPSEAFTATISGTAEANSNVKLYTTTNCTGAVAHDLTATGGNFSVTITVAANSTTTYYGTARDAAGNISSCTVTPVTYSQQDLTPPLMPVISSITPVGPSDVNTPTVSGTGEAGTTIKAYTDNACSSSVVGTATVGAVGDFSVPVNSVDNTATTYYVTATDGNNNASACSSTSVSYTSYSIPEGMGWFTGATTTNAAATTTNINQATAYSLRFTMSEYHSTYYTHSRTVNPHQITIATAGDYLLNYTIPYTSVTAGASVRAEVRVNGVVVDTSRGESGYISNASNAHRESSLHNTTLLSGLNANDVIDVTVIRAGVAATATVTGTASLGLEYIESTRNIFFAKSDRTTNSTDLNQSIAYPAQWTSVVNDGIYAHNNFSNSENITINSGGHYLAAINIPLESATAQANVKVIVKLNGTALNFGNATQGIIRGTTHLASSVHWFAMIPNVVSGTVVTVETVAEAVAGSVITPAGRKASIYLEQIPATGLFFTRGSTLVTNNNWNNIAAGQNVRWTTDVVLDSSTYSHSTSTNPQNITLLQAGDYMVAMNTPLTSPTASTNVTARLRVDAVAVAGADAKSSYVSATSGHNEASNTLMFLLRKRTANQVLDVLAIREANAGTVSSSGDACLMVRYRPNSVTP